MVDALSNQTSNLHDNQNAISSKITPIIFEGKFSEYFGIWIVNLLLSLVTFGIYSAWAKVRRKKYFYNNSLIDNVGFDYHAKPISILKGRLIAVALLAIAAVNPILQSLVFLIIFIFLPWLVVRGSIFNARNSSHRGLRFDFVGTVSQAVRVFVGLPLLTMITFGLAAPYVSHERKQFLMNSHQFGLSKFHMKRVVKQFYKVYLILIIVPLIGILAAIAIPAYKSYVDSAKAAVAPHTQLNSANIQAFVAIGAQPKILLAANEPDKLDTAKSNAEKPSKVERIYSENAAENTNEIAADATQPVATAEAANHAMAEPKLDPQPELQPDQAIQDEIKANTDMQEKMSEQELAARAAEMAQEDAAEQTMTAQQKMMQWMQNPSMLLFMLLGALAYLLFIFAFLGYLQARIGNLVWNNTTLDKLSFKSSLRARDFAWLYLTNIIAIMLTFGLATPWAQIRMARYRAAKLQIVGDVDFDQFVGDKKAEVKATGEEIAEMFDVDLSFG